MTASDINTASSHLLAFLKKPDKIRHYQVADWALLIRTAKTCKLSAHIGRLISEHDLGDAVPEKIQNHFIATQKIVEFRRNQALWEIDRLQRALQNTTTPIVALKGCAYLLAKLPFADSRLLSDVDIMVPKADLAAIEAQLTTQQWQSQKVNDYDQHYYREWMHEIPPLRHITRSIEVDLHHTIIPPTSRLKPDPALLFADAQTVRGNQRFLVLSPCDMLLHSAIHLFYDSDLSNKLRDLVDLDQLIRHFTTQQPDFVAELVKRAQQSGLERPLYYALRYCQLLLDTPVPKQYEMEIQAIAPSFMVRKIMDLLVPLAILPEHPEQHRKTVGFARWLLYVRSHYLRMPLRLLIPHLLKKSLRKPADS